MIRAHDIEVAELGQLTDLDVLAEAVESHGASLADSIAELPEGFWGPSPRICLATRRPPIMWMSPFAKGYRGMTDDPQTRLANTSEWRWRPLRRMTDPSRDGRGRRE